MECMSLWWGQTCRTATGTSCMGTCHIHVQEELCSNHSNGAADLNHQMWLAACGHSHKSAQVRLHTTNFASVLPAKSVFDRLSSSYRQLDRVRPSQFMSMPTADTSNSIR